MGCPMSGGRPVMATPLDPTRDKRSLAWYNPTPGGGVPDCKTRDSGPNLGELRAATHNRANRHLCT